MSDPPKNPHARSAGRPPLPSVTDASPLPVLFVHGAWVWRLMLAAVVAAVTVAWASLARARDRRRRAAAAAARTLGISAPIRGPVKLRGVVRDGALASVHPGRHAETEWRTHARAGTAWLDCAGERIELPGEVDIEHGAATRDLTGLPGALAVAFNGGRGGRTLHVVGEGDEVVATGVLARAAGDPMRWVLGPSAPAPHVLVAALAPRAARARGRGLALVAVALGTGLVTYGALHAVGRAALASAATARPGGSEAVVTAVDSNDALAAMMPGSRGRALADAAVQFEDRAPHDPAGAALVIASAELADGCAGRIRGELAVDDAEAAAADAARCGLPALAVEPLLLLGRYAEAATAVDPADPRAAERALTAFVGASRWADAAATLDRIGVERAADAAARSTQDLALRDVGALERMDQETASRRRCAAELFRAWGGDADAAARLATSPAPDASDACRVAAALSLPAAAQPAALAAARATLGEIDTDDRALVDALAGWPATDREWDAWLAPTAAHLAGSRAAITEWLALSDAREPVTIGALEAAAVVAIYRDDAATATHDVDQAAALLALRPAGEAPGPPDDAGNGRAVAERARRRQRIAEQVMDLRGALALHTPSVQVDRRPYSRIDDELALRTGAPPTHAGSLAADGCAANLPRTLAGHAGAPIAAMITECGLGGRFEALRAVLPRVVAGREELAVAAKSLRRGDRSGNRDAPYEVLTTASLLRDVHRLLGNQVEATAWQVVIDRHVAMLADRRRATAFAFLAAR